MTRLLVTGAGGMLGRDLVTVLNARSDLKVTAAGRADLDVTDPTAARAAVAEHDIVINTAAWTNVDGAEADEAAATAVNGHGVANLASACAASGTRLIQISTDYVLAGDAQSPYPEDAPTAPVNAYGRGKLVGEQAVARLLPDSGYVVRTAWLYGAHGPNFVATMLRLATQREYIDVVDDQHGQPTWSYRLAEQLVALADAALAGQAAAGVYHSTCAGQTTWYGLARAAFTLAGLDPDRIRPTTSDRYPRPAPRPAYSVLAHGRWAAAGLPSLPDWHATLVDAFDSPTPPAPWKVA
ncbi:dTDP-4-dehydrorhamnose reductase [Micromonospora sp. NPDC048839]|uniref:dTDP-4-dehydrorhamnose reductase n=1 Tax=Micromonospora sp. NPDC048839 TaxID=3155641 RepID=UPI0033D2CA71